MNASMPSGKSLSLKLLALLGAVASAALFYVWLSHRTLAAELVRSEPVALLKNPTLVEFALRQAVPVYAEHCASCHGVMPEGKPKAGVPSLVDSSWLYSNDLVSLEQIVLYGIRSGHPRSRNLADMPALGRLGVINDEQIEDIVQYVLNISGQRADAARAEQGRQLFYGKGNCYDCHGGDARGVAEYGTPSLVGNVWIYGGDRDSLFSSIANGRHGLCPSRAQMLTPLQVRALAVSLHQGVSHSE